MGKSERKNQDESSSFSRCSENDRRRQRTQTESVVSSTSARKSSRGDDRDRDFNPTSTSYSSTSRNPYRGTTSASVASSYATASSKPRDATILPPELVRNSALINETTNSRSGREERDRDEDTNRKSGKRRECSTSKDRKSRRSGSLDRGDRKKEKKERRERQKDDDGRKDRGVTRSESDYMRERGVSRAESMPIGGSGNFSAQIGGSGFTQFPGQYDGGLPSFSPRPVHHPEGMSTHVQDQFSGQFPAESTAPYRPPLATNEGGPGLATEYYGDAGESVAYQPGVRPQQPSLIVGAEPHLQAALAIAAPPPEPSASGSVGAAASFYSTSENFQSPSMSASKLSKQPRPGASSQVSSSSGPAAMAGGAALGYIAASHHDRVNNQSSQNYSNRPLYQPSFPLTSPNITTNVGYSTNANQSTSAPVLPTLAAATAAGYVAGNIHSPHRQDSMTQRYSTTSHTSNLPNLSQRPQTNITSQAETSIIAEHSQTPGRHSSNPSNIPLYAAGAAGIAGLAAAEYQHNHNDHDSNHNLSHTQRYHSGSMAQRHRHHGPLDKFVDFWKDPDGVAQFEEYTEYIGVCRYCFAPDSSAKDAPRKHYYRRRKGSNERYGSSIRVDKDSRYSSSDGETRRKSKNSWLATGLVGYGLAKVGKNLFSTNNDKDNVYDLRRTRVNKSSTSLNSRRRNSSTERRSYTSRGVTRRSDVGLPHRSEQVETGITADGKVYRREKYVVSRGGLTATMHGSRYRSRSRSRERKTGITEAVVDATLGSAALASRLRKRSESPDKSPLRLNHQSQEQHSEVGLSLDTVSSSRRHNEHPSSNLSRRSSSAVVDARSSNPEPKSGFFGGFFASSPEKRRNQRKKSKNNGFFTLENGSSSSADTNLAFGSRSDLSRTKNSSKRREKPHKNSNTTLIGLGAAAAMLAANEARKHDQGKRRADFVAVKDAKDHHKRTSEPARKMINVAPSGVDEEAWESASEEDDVASIDSTLAYGMHRRSHESLRSDSSGTEKWGWRWGGKKTRRQSSPPQRHYSTGAAAALAGVAVGAALTSQGHQQPQPDNSHSELPPLQHVYPVPTSDPSHYDVVRHNSMISSTEPLVTARPGPIPLQQPQPVTQVPSAVYATQAPYGHSYSAPSGPPVMSQLPHHYAPISSSGRPLESRQVVVPDSFPRNDYPPRAMLHRGATNDGSSSQRESPTPSKSNYSTDSRRPSAREDALGVRFDLTKEHEDREWRDRRRQEKEERRARRESEGREAMEQANLERERRQPEKASEELVDDKARRLEQIDRELEMLKRQGPGAKSDKSNTWNAALAGVAGAAVGAAIVKDGERHEERREQQRRDVLDQNTFDIENRRFIVEEDLERTSRAEQEARIVRQAAAKIRKTPSPVHENYAAYFVPPELSQAHKADNAIDSTSPHVITIEPGEHRDTSAISNTLPHPDDDTDSNRMSSTLPWHLPRIGMTLNLIQPTPPASTTGSTKGDSSPLIRAQDVAEPVIEVSPESRRSSRVTFSEPDIHEYEVITPIEHRDEFVGHNEMLRDSEDTHYGVHTKEVEESINSFSEDTSPIEEIPRVERMPGGFDDDIDFAATVAAGLEHTGFDPSIVIDDPDFRRRESPPGSEQFPFHRSPFTTNLSNLGLESPGTEGAPPVRGFVIGELPPTPKEVTLSKSSIEEDELDPELTRRENNEGEEAAKRQDTEDIVQTAADLVRPAQEDEVIDVSPAYKANVEVADSGTKDLSEEFDSTVSPIRSKSKSKLKKNRKNGSAYEPQNLDSTVEREVAKDQYFDATESPRSIAEDLQQKNLQEIARNIPLPDDKDGSPLFDQRDSFPEITKSIDETELYDSPSEEVASIAASAPALGDYREPRKQKKKKSKHRSSEFNDTASLASAPAAFDDTPTSNSKSKKDKKGGLFGLFGRSVSDSAEMTRSKDSPSEATFEEFEERKKKSRNSKERRSTRDDNDLYSLASASTVDVSRLDDEKSGGKSRRAKENGDGEKRRRHRDSRGDDDSGRITQDLPAKVYVPVSPGRTPEFSASASLTDPENREYTAAKAEPPSSIEPDEATIHDEQKTSMSFLGERQEPKRPPDIEKEESITEYPRGVEPFYQDSIESRPSSPTLVGSMEDLHSIPTDPSVSSEATLLDRPKRLSMLRLTDPSHPNASASPTAIPINLRTPRFAGFSRSSPSTPEASTENSMHFTPRQRQPRPSSTDFKSSTEFRPLWLVERHSNRQVPTTDEIYPSLPSSHSTSRASSIHGTIEDHDPFQGVAPDYAVDTSPPAETRSLKIDTSDVKEPDLLDSQQATPTIASFQSNPIMDADLLKRDGNFTERTLPGIQGEDSVFNPSQRTTHSVDDFFLDRRSQSPSRYDLERKVNLPLPQNDQGIEHDAPSMNKDVGLEALTGAVAMAASHLSSPYHEQHSQEGTLINSFDDVEPAEKMLEHSKDETLLADEPEFSLSTKSKKKKSKQQRKASEITSAQDNLSAIEISSPSASGKYMGVEDRRKLEEQDAQDAVDSWFAPSISKKVKKETKGKKTRYVDVSDPERQSAEISGNTGPSRSVNTYPNYIVENASDIPHIQLAEESESLGPANLDSSKTDLEHVEPGTLTKDMSSAEVVAVMATAAATTRLLNESADSTIPSSQVIPNLHSDSSSRGRDEVVLPKSPIEQPDVVGNSTADIGLPIQLEREVSYETNPLSSPSDFYTSKKNKKGKKKASFLKAEPLANLEEQRNTDTLPIDEVQPDQADKQTADMATSRKKKSKKGRKALQWNEPEENFASGGREQSGLEDEEENTDLSRDLKPAEGDILVSGDIDKDSPELAGVNQIEATPVPIAPEEVALPAGDDVDLYEAYPQESIPEPALATIEEPAEGAVSEKVSPLPQPEDLSFDQDPNSKDGIAAGLVTDSKISDIKELPSAEPRLPYDSLEEIALPKNQDHDLLDALPESPPLEAQEMSEQDTKELLSAGLPYHSPEELALPGDQDLDLPDALPESPALEIQEMSERDAKEPPFTEPRFQHNFPEETALPKDQDLDLLNAVPKSPAFEAQNTKALPSVEPRLSYNSPEEIVLPEDQDLDLLDASPKSPALEAQEMSEQEHSSGLVERLLLDHHEPTSQSREPEADYPSPEENSSLYVPGLSEKSDFDEALRGMAITDKDTVDAKSAIDSVHIRLSAPIDKDLINEKSLASPVDPILQDSTEDDFAVSNEKGEKGKGIDSSLPATPIAGNNAEDVKVNPFANAEIIQNIQESQVENPQGLEARRQAVQLDEWAPPAKRKGKKSKKRASSYQELPLEPIKEPDAESTAIYDDTNIPLGKISDFGEIRTTFNASDREPKQFNESFNSKNLPEDIRVLKHTRQVPGPTTQDQDTSRSYNSLMKEPIMEFATPDPVQDDEWGYETKKKGKKGKRSQGVALEGASADQRSELSPQESVQSLAVVDTPRQIPSILDAQDISADRGPTISLETTEPDEDLWDRPSRKNGKKGKKSVDPGVVDVEGSVLPKATEVPPAKDGSTGDTSLGKELFKEFSTKGSRKAKKNKRKTLSTALSQDADSFEPLDQTPTLEKSPSREHTLPDVVGPEVGKDSVIPSADVTILAYDHDVLRGPEIRESESSGQPLTEIGEDVHEPTIQGPIAIPDISDQPIAQPVFKSRDHQHSQGEATLRQSVETSLPVDDSEKEVTSKQAVETSLPVDESEGEPRLKEAVNDSERQVTMKQASGNSFQVDDSEGGVTLKQAIENLFRVDDSELNAVFEQAVETSLPSDDANGCLDEITLREEASSDTVGPTASQQEETVLGHEDQSSASDQQSGFKEQVLLYKSSQPVSPADDSEHIPKTHEISEEVKNHDEVDHVLHARRTYGRQLTPVFSPIEFTDDTFQDEARSSSLPLNDADDYFGDQSKQHRYLEEDLDDGRDFMISPQLGRLLSLPHVESQEIGTSQNAIGTELPTLSPTNEAVYRPDEPPERATSHEEHSQFPQEGPILVGSSESRPIEEAVVNEPVTSAISEDKVEEFHAVDRYQGATSYEAPPYTQDTIRTQGEETSDRASGIIASPKEAKTALVESSWRNTTSRENTVAFKPKSDPEQSLFETSTAPILAERSIEGVPHHSEIQEENNITEDQHTLPTEEKNEIEAPDAEKMIEESQTHDVSSAKTYPEQTTDNFDNSEVSSAKKTKNGKKARKSQPLDWTEESERIKEDKQSIPTMVDDPDVAVRDGSAVSGSQIPSFATVIASKGEPKGLENPSLKKSKNDKRKAKKGQILDWIDEPVTPALKEETSTLAIALDTAKDFELSGPSTPQFENFEDGKAEPADLASSTSNKSKKDKRKGKNLLLPEWNDEPESEVINAPSNPNMARDLEEPKEIAQAFQAQEDQLDNTPETPFEPEAEESFKSKKSKKEKKRSKKPIPFDLNEDPDILPSQQTPSEDVNPAIEEFDQVAARATGLETPGDSVDVFSSVKGKKNKKKGKKSQFLDWLEPEPRSGTELKPEAERVTEPETERERDLRPEPEDVIEPEIGRVLEPEPENVVGPGFTEHIIQPEREAESEPERAVESGSMVGPEIIAEPEITIEHKSRLKPEAIMEAESVSESQPELQTSDLPRNAFDRDEEGTTQTPGSDMRDLELTSGMANVSKSQPITESPPEPVTESRLEPIVDPQPEPEPSEILSTYQNASGLAAEDETKPQVNETRGLDIISDFKADEPEPLMLKEGRNGKSKEGGLQASNWIEEPKLSPYEATAAKTPEADSQDSPKFAEDESRGITPGSISKLDSAESDVIKQGKDDEKQLIAEPVVFESGKSEVANWQDIDRDLVGATTGNKADLVEDDTRDAGSFEEATHGFDGFRPNSTKKGKKNKKSSKKAQSSLENDQAKLKFDSETLEADDQDDSGFIQDGAAKPDDFEFSNTKKTKKGKKKAKKEQVPVKEREPEPIPTDEQFLDFAAGENLGVRNIDTADVGALEESIADPDELGSFSLKKTKKEKKKSKKASNVFDERKPSQLNANSEAELSTPVYTELQQNVLLPETQQEPRDIIPERLNQDPSQYQGQDSDKIEQQSTEYQEDLSLPKGYSLRPTSLSNQQISEALKDDVTAFPQEQVQHPYNEVKESIHSMEPEVESAAFNPADEIQSNIVNLPESVYLQDASVAVRAPDPSTNPFVSEDRVLDEGTPTSIQEVERINSLATDENFRTEAIVKEPKEPETDQIEDKLVLDFVGFTKKKNKKSKRKGQLLEESEKQLPASTGEPSNSLESSIISLPEGSKNIPSEPLQNIREAREARDASIDEFLPVSTESQQFSSNTEAAIPLQPEWMTSSRAEEIDYDEGREGFPPPEASDFSTYAMKSKKKGKKSKKQQPVMFENENTTQARIDDDPTGITNTETSVSTSGARQASSGLLPVEVSEEAFEDSHLGHQMENVPIVRESVPLEEHVYAEGSTSKSLVPHEDSAAYEEHDGRSLYEPVKIIEPEQATPGHQLVSDEREGYGELEKQRSPTTPLHDPDPQTSFEQEPPYEINQVPETHPEAGTSEFVLSKDRGVDETPLNDSWTFPVDNNADTSTLQQAISIPWENSPLSLRISSDTPKEVNITSFNTFEEPSNDADLEYRSTSAQPQEDNDLSANQPKEPWELPVPKKSKKAKGLKRHSDNFDLPDPSNLQKLQLKDETHLETSPKHAESRARGSLGGKRTLSGVGAGIALFESFQQVDASQDTKKSKKKRKGSRWSDSDEITEIIPSLAQNQVQDTEFPASISYEHDHSRDVKDNGEDDPPSHEPQVHHPPSLPVTTASQPWVSEPKSPTYRDSGVHISDSPMLPEHTPVYHNVRDSGYQGAETSPTVGSDHEISRRTTNEQDLINSHDRPSTYGHQDRSQSYEEAHSANSTNRSSMAETSENPLKISIKVDPTYDVSISRPERHQSFTELDQDNSQQRYPSPVDSTSKDRSSVLFESSPSTREEVAVYRTNPAFSPPTRCALVDESTVGGSSGLLRSTATPIQERSLLNTESDTYQAPSASLFGGPVGFNSDLGPVSSPPVGTDSSSRRKLNTITEYSPEESPLNKKSRDLSDVGVPEHGVKTLRRSETPQGFSQHRIKSPQGREAQNSTMISTDELLSRMSWPAVDEDNHAVDLDRSISRNTSSERRASGHQSNVSLMSADPSRHHEGEKRSFSGASIRSGESIHAIIRSPNGLSTKSSSTPPLRRVDRSISGDLRGASKRGEARKLAKQADAALESQTVASSSTYDPVIDKGKARIIPMTDVYVSLDMLTLRESTLHQTNILQEGWGDVQSSPRSPTRPPSLRRHQSMHILDLETRLDQLVSENRLLQEAKTRAERSLDDASHGHDRDRNGLKEALETRDLWLKQKDTELDELRGLLEGLQHEVLQLNEVNEGLTGARSEFAAEHQQRYNELETEHINTHRQWQESTKELEQLKQKHTKLASGMEGIVRHEINIALDKKNTEIRELRDELLDAKEQVRRLQQQILASKPNDDFLTNRDEDYFDNQCQQLCQHVQQWVLRFSKFSDMRPSRSMADVADEKITDRFDNAVLDGSDVDVYLSDRVKRRDVFMSVVMAMVWEYIFTRYLFGMDREQRQKLKSLEKTLAEVAPLPAVHKWRATTLAMLSQREAFVAQRAQDTEAVVQEIYDTLAVFLPPPSHLVNQIQESLRNVMRTAVDLSIEMRTQKTEYIMLPPLQPEYDTNGDLVHKVHFNASLMNERSGDTTSNEALSARQAVVRMVLFPLVVKKGDDQGQSDEEIVICPAQVLVARENDGRGKQKSSARSASGGDRMEGLSVGNRSVQSFAPSSMEPGMMGGMS